MTILICSKRPSFKKNLSRNWKKQRYSRGKFADILSSIYWTLGITRLNKATTSISKSKKTKKYKKSLTSASELRCGILRNKDAIAVALRKIL